MKLPRIPIAARFVILAVVSIVVVYRAALYIERERGRERSTDEFLTMLCAKLDSLRAADPPRFAPKRFERKRPDVGVFQDFDGKLGSIRVVVDRAIPNRTVIVANDSCEMVAVSVTDSTGTTEFYLNNGRYAFLCRTNDGVAFKIVDIDSSATVELFPGIDNQ